MSALKTKTKTAEVKLTTYHATAPVELAEGSRESVIELLRVGTIRDRDLHITADMLNGHVENFKAGTYGVDLQVNLGHCREGEAAGWIKDVFVKEADGVLSEYATVEWNDLGIEKISSKRYKYISSEFTFEYQDDATGEWRNHVLIGAALTNIPAMKRQKPVSLSEEELTRNHHMFKKYIENMKKRVKLSAEDVADMRQMLSEASEEDQEASKQDVEDLAKKQEEQAKADADAAAEAAKVQAAKDAETAQLNEKGGVVSLAEHNALKQKIATMELNEEVDGSLMCSEKNPTGFRPDAKSDVVGFMLSLSEGQRVAFKGLMTKLSSVDFSTHGKSGEEAVSVQLSAESDVADKIVALSTKYHSEGLSAADAQKKATAEVMAASKK